MELIDQITQLAVGYCRAAMATGPDDNGTFRMLSTIHVAGEAKPLLLLGNANRKYDDGHCIAILNPDAALVDKLGAGTGYNGTHLKEMVTKRCDVMLDVWVVGETRTTIGSKYKAHNFRAANFVVR